jgi:hypothetical protein
MDDRVVRGDLAANPQAAAAAERIRAEQGFDPLDESTVHQAVTDYRKLFRRWRRWSLISVWPLILVTVAIIVAVAGRGYGVRPFGLVLAGVGAAIAAFPLHRSVRALRDLARAMRVIRAYQNVLRAAQPTARHGGAAVRKWRRSQFLG